LRYLFLLFKGIGHDAIGETAAAEIAYRESVALNHNPHFFMPHFALVDLLVRQDWGADAQELMPKS
jgi:hypothetical protein